ncbi:MAG: membrane protein insertase YidC [Treponemataceae bacterium]
MDKNTIWAVVVSCIVLVAFMFIQTKVLKPQAGTEIPEEIAQIEQVTGESSSAELGIVPVAKKYAANIPEQTIEINTNVSKVVLTNKGGDIIKYELLQHKDKGNNVQMADSVSELNRACSIAFGKAEDVLVRGIINDNFKVTKIDNFTYIFEQKFSSKDSEGKVTDFVMQKKYTFHENDYLFKLDVSLSTEDGKIINSDDVIYTLLSSPQIGPHYDRKKDRYENRTFIAFTKDKAKKQTVKDNQYRIYDKPYTWTAVAGKYFTFIMVPQNQEAAGNLLYSRSYNNNEEKYSNAQIMMERKSVNSNNVDTYYIYAGPKTSKNLKVYNKAETNNWDLTGLRLDETLNTSGLLSWLEIAMKWCMEMIYKIVPNWGVAIIIMTILLKFAMFPLTRKSQLSSIKMQEVQPKMQEIQKKYKDNPQKMNEEMSKFYKEVGYNPMSGCLPLLIQFPLLMAMFNLFNNYFEFRGAMFIPGWIPDLSVGDTVFSFNFNIPFIGSELRILPFIYLATQLLYGLITNYGGMATGQNATQMKIMTYAMPAMFFFMFYNAPSGLILYWTIANVFTMVQQIILNKSKKKRQAELERQKEINGGIPKFVPKKKKK